MNDAGIEEFKRTLAHELKNPLGAAKGALELLLDAETLGNAEERERMMRLALRNVERALQLVDELRSPRPDAERVAGSPAP